MHSGGRLVGAVAVALLTACSSADEAGSGTTTTTATTATTAPASTTTAKPAARKATTTTAPKRTATTVQELAQVADEAELSAADLEQFMVQPAAEWSRMSDAEFGTGPVDVDRAASEEADNEHEVAAVRRVLQDLGFLVGYSRAWERRPALDESPRAGDTTNLFAALYVFATPQGAAGYRQAAAAAFEEGADPEEVRPIEVTDIPGARAWQGGNRDEGFFTVVLFAVSDAYVQILCTSTTGARSDCHVGAPDTARKQYDILRRLVG